MKLVEFSRGYEGMPEGVRGEPVFIAPGYITTVSIAASRGPSMSFINLVDGDRVLVLGAVGDVANRLADALDRLHDANLAPQRAVLPSKTVSGQSTWRI